MYRKSLLFLISSLFLLSLSASSQHYQKIILDDYHSSVRQDPKDQTPHNYKIKAGAGLILDASTYDYTFVRNLNHGQDPDKIFLIIDGGTFEFPLNLHGESIIDKKHAISLKSSDTFTGFKKGRAMLVVGTLKVEEGTGKMMTSWVSLIDIE